MSQKFAIVTDGASPLKIFDGSTGAVIRSYTPPSQFTSGGGYSTRINISYDGNIVALQTFSGTKIWFLNIATGAQSQLEIGETPTTCGFDGNGRFYVELYKKYLRIDPPYSSFQSFSFAQPINIVPCQTAEKSVAIFFNAQGVRTVYRFDLSTGIIGSVFGSPSAYQVDNKGTHVFGLHSISNPPYGAKQWNYETGAAEGSAGPSSGNNQGRSRVIGFTGDGLKWAMKTGESSMGFGRLGDSLATIPMTSVLPLSGDNSSMIFEGLLDDTVALFSQADFSRNLLVAFDLVTGQIKWSNNNGDNHGDVSQPFDCATAGVQPIYVQGGVIPPDPPGFWKELILAYETP